ncbi:MAG TPA: class I SAM-dependent methyltransferase [Candidatus Atribacteria bacterium]|nr:class I SAM-dependent methyltransferase [Candidatus Atribacteria bacterium]
MNPVLEEIMRSGYTESPNGERVKVYGAVSLEEGLFLQGIIRDIKPVVCVDIGLGLGVSSLFICDALAKTLNACLITIDPKQFSTEKGIGYCNGTHRKGIGLNSLRKAGYKEMIKFYEAPSHLVLPKLEDQCARIDFAFIDGWHTFDYTLLDFFYVDRILRVGGVVAIHDTNRPAIRKVCRFIVTNRSYSVFPLQKKKQNLNLSITRRVIGRIAQLLPKRIRHLFEPEFIEPDESLGLVPHGSVMAFKKEAEYLSKSDYYHEF